MQVLIGLNGWGSDRPCCDETCYAVFCRAVSRFVFKLPDLCIPERRGDKRSVCLSTCVCKVKRGQFISRRKNRIAAAHDGRRCFDIILIMKFRNHLIILMTQNLALKVIERVWSLRDHVSISIRVSSNHFGASSQSPTSFTTLLVNNPNQKYGVQRANNN